MNIQNNKQNKHLPMRLWTLLVSVLCFGSFAFAQTTAFKGKVVDEASAPLAGVSVSVKGTTVGTITDLNGDSLHFSNNRRSSHWFLPVYLHRHRIICLRGLLLAINYDLSIVLLNTTLCHVVHQILSTM